MRHVVGTLMIAVAAQGASAQSPPNTDIYLAPLKMTAAGRVVGPFVNITNRPGYDNQPSFTPDGRSILFTSVHEDNQADIYRYDIARGDITRVTSTSESEYSPAVMPGGTRFSVIRVESDSTQRLWSFALDGSDPQLVLSALKPAGYHAWIGHDDLALFVLGRPNALVHANVTTGVSDTLARDVGRSLSPLIDRTGFSFVQQRDSATRVLKEMRWPSRAVRDLITLPRGTEDVAWVTPDEVLAGQGGKLLVWKRGAPVWTTLTDRTASGITNITRLAVSPDGKWLALVAIPKP